MRRRQKYITIKYVSDPSWGNVYIIDEGDPSKIALAVRGIESLVVYLLNVFNVPEKALEKYYPKIKWMSYGDTLKIPVPTKKSANFRSTID